MAKGKAEVYVFFRKKMFALITPASVPGRIIMPAI